MEESAARARTGKSCRPCCAAGEVCRCDSAETLVGVDSGGRRSLGRAGEEARHMPSLVAVVSVEGGVALERTGVALTCVVLKRRGCGLRRSGGGAHLSVAGSSSASALLRGSGLGVPRGLGRRLRGRELAALLALPHRRCRRPLLAVSGSGGPAGRAGGRSAAAPVGSPTASHSSCSFPIVVRSSAPLLRCSAAPSSKRSGAEPLHSIMDDRHFGPCRQAPAPMSVGGPPTARSRAHPDRLAAPSHPRAA